MLPIVIIIWGIVIYKIIAAFSPDPVAISDNFESTFVAPKFQKKEVFTLLPIESDPFLGILYVNPEKNKNNNKTSSKPKKDLIWPEINYLGIVSDKDSKASVFILQINGKQHLLKKGETLEEFKVIKGSKDKIFINYKGKTKEFTIM